MMITIFGALRDSAGSETLIPSRRPMTLRGDINTNLKQGSRKMLQQGRKAAAKRVGKYRKHIRTRVAPFFLFGTAIHLGFNRRFMLPQCAEKYEFLS